MTSLALERAPVIPDSIEPVEGWRRWMWDGSRLLSVTNSTIWTPGEALHAECNAGHGERYRWEFSRAGLTYDQAVAIVTAKSYAGNTSMVMFGKRYNAVSSIPPPPPRVTPPDGYGLKLVTEKHAAPHENCTCGIYAAASLDQCPAGEIAGKVKMWGKTVPGSYGYRAEYAYPSELHVPRALENHPAILAFGVPVTVADPNPANASLGGLQAFMPSNRQWMPLTSWVTPSVASAQPISDRNRGARHAMYAATALNIGCAALNVGIHFLR